MKAPVHHQGIGSVEQISMQAVYEKGKWPICRPRIVDLRIHAIRKTKKRAMPFSVNFGGPG